MNLIPRLHPAIAGVLDGWSCRMMVRVQYTLFFLGFSFFYLQPSDGYKGRLFDQMGGDAYAVTWGLWFLLLAAVQASIFCGFTQLLVGRIRTVFFILGTATAAYMFTVPMVLFLKEGFLPSATVLIFNNLVLFIWCAITAPWPVEGNFS